MNNFRVGQKVVCVDAQRAPMLTHGAVYTVAGFDDAPGIDALGRWCEYGVLLHEVTSTRDAFSSHRFRPVKTTSIEIFRAMLVTPPKVRTPA